MATDPVEMQRRIQQMQLAQQQAQQGNVIGGVGGIAGIPGAAPPQGMMATPPAPAQQMGPPAPQQGPPSSLAPPPPIMDDATLDDLSSINRDVQAEKGLADRLAQARALRDTAMPEGRSGGGIYTAANPLEFIGAGIKQYKGEKRSRELEAALEKTRGEIGRKEGGFTKAAAKEKGLGSIFGGLGKKKKSDDED